MTQIATLTIADGVRVVVPDSLDLITPYILREQQDWFEDEIKFLRRHLQPGEKAIDIGANYGVYTLSMAFTVGSRGAVYAFEPAAATAELLKQGIAANGFDNVVLEISALSNAVGTARLATGDGAELNALEQIGSSATAGETVRVVTLDDAMLRYGWTNIDVVKIDAEGEERRIIEGGREFFSKCSPLVLYEVKAGDALHFDLVRDFAALGYESYRLVPGLDVLVPFDASRQVDPYLLNLFCCKPDRAAFLAGRGLLVERAQQLHTPTKSSPPKMSGGVIQRLAKLGNLWRSAPAARSDAWLRLTEYPYGAKLAGLWRSSSAAAAGRSEVDQALADYLSSQDRKSSAAERFSALQRAHHTLAAVCADHPTHLRHASLARVASELGERAAALDALGYLDRTCVAAQRPADMSEPFLAVMSRFDSLAPGEDIQRWLVASILQGLETASAYSSIFLGQSALPRLEAIEAVGYTNEEMRRRLQLVRSRFPSPHAQVRPRV